MYINQGNATGRSVAAEAVLLERGWTDTATAEAVTSPEAAFDVLGPWLALYEDREACVMALLNTKHRLLDVQLVSLGSIDHTFMAPREVFRIALLGNASAVVLAHNHPSGDTTPSADDLGVTRRLTSAGELVGVEVLDHLVIAGPRWTSIARRNQGVLG